MSTLAALAPSGYVFLITPDDDNDLEATTRAISFASAGTLHIIDASGNDVEIPDGALAAGAMHPIRARRVLEDSTCTGIVGYAG